MKSILSIITFAFVVLFYNNVQGQSQQQQGAITPQQLILIEQPGSLVVTPALNDPSNEVIPALNSPDEIQMIDGRKVLVDNQGIQSLSVPENVPLKEVEKRKPE